MGISRRLSEGRDPAALAAFRILFGALMVFAVVRFWAKGWIHELYIAPDYHFSYDGFGWVQPWPGVGMYVHYALMGASALLVAVGLWTRWAAGALFVTFTYAELIDKTTYLNHYYLVSLLALLLVFVRSDAAYSIAARRGRGQPLVPAWNYHLLRGQIAVVYFFAGLAKLDGDWLLRAEPLKTWLVAYADWPVLGTVFSWPATAYAMSWFGAVFDLSIAFWLSRPRTRPWAYAVAVAFHASIWVLFPVGIFSWVMLVGATLFFSPTWPRRAPSVVHPALAMPRIVPPLLALYFAVQVAVPLRHVAYPGEVNWNEQGFRFAWRVMLIEKAGQVSYRVETDRGRFEVFPRKELSPFQYRMMSTQPDMIRQYARRVADRFSAEGHRDVQVYADAWASLNGRPSQRLVSPDKDLLKPGAWIEPLRPR